MNGIPDAHNARSSPSTRKLNFGAELHSSELISLEELAALIGAEAEQVPARSYSGSRITGCAAAGGRSGRAGDHAGAAVLASSLGHHVNDRLASLIPAYGAAQLACSFKNRADSLPGAQGATRNSLSKTPEKFKCHVEQDYRDECSRNSR